MADEANEDSWLYGTSNPDSTTNDEERIVDDEVTAETAEMSTKSENEALAAIIGGDIMADGVIPDKGTELAEEEAEMGEFEDLGHEADEGERANEPDNIVDTTDIVKKEDKQEAASDADVDDEDDDSEDDINVVIGEMKTPSTYNIKQRSNLILGAAGQDKIKPSQVGKFSIEDFEGAGTINGVAAHEFSIDSLEEKPWRKPGADITDYFNYGFNEETWRAYCERQKRFRVVESGVGLASLTQNLNPLPDKQQPIESSVQVGVLHPGVVTQGTTSGSLNDHMQIPPPGLIPLPTHQVPPLRFCVMPRPVRPITTATSSKENAIQVMTAECREYSRTGQAMSNFGGMGPGDESYFHEPEPFDYGYEPTQEQNWGNENSNWMPSGIKELTPGPNVGPPLQMAGPPTQLRPPPHAQAVMPPSMNTIPPNIVPQVNMGPPPPLGLMMGPNGAGGGPAPIRMPMGPPRLMTPNVPSERIDEDRERRRREREWERERERERENVRSRRERSRSREKSRRRSKSREKEREKDREKDRDRDRERDRGREAERERERNEKTDDNERSEEERERRRRERERERERERDRERSRRERSRSREKSRRRSKSREKERERSSKTTASSNSVTSSRNDKKKSHRKEDEE